MLARASSPPSHALGLAYAVTIYGLYWRRFVMAAHYSSHAPAFRGDGTAGTVLNNVASCALGPFFGMPCGLYAMRHELMHSCVHARMQCTNLLSID